MSGSGAAMAVFLILVCSLTVWAENVCQLVNKGYRKAKAKVKPFSPQKLEVSWEDVSENCSDDQVVIIKEEAWIKGTVDYTVLEKAMFSQQKVTIDKNPCHRYDIIVEIDGQTSWPNNYNLDQDPNEIFGGFLKQELPKFCPFKSKSLEMPPALKNCIAYHNWTHTNGSTEIFVQIKEPKFPKVTSEEVINLSFRFDACTTSEDLGGGSISNTIRSCSPITFQTSSSGA